LEVVDFFALVRIIESDKVIGGARPNIITNLLLDKHQIRRLVMDQLLVILDKDKGALYG